ncbi:blue light receptor [Agyrium rufum]|nr:blue light receptor [Agyrium rufum]
MAGNYSRQYSSDDLQRIALANNQTTMMNLMGANNMNSSRGQSLDEIISRNNKEEQRRRFSQQYSTDAASGISANDPRRSSMLEFGATMSADLNGFQFNPSSVPISSSMPQGAIAQRRRAKEEERRVVNNMIAVNTQFGALPPNFSSNDYSQSPMFEDPLPMDPTSAMSLDANDYMDDRLPLDINYVNGLNDDVMTGGVTPMNVFGQASYETEVGTPAVLNGVSNSLGGTAHTNGMIGLSRDDQDLMDKGINMAESIPSNRLAPPGPPTQANDAQSIHNSDLSPAAPHMPGTQTSYTTDPSQTTGDSSNDMQAQRRPPSQYKSIYSSSGFDMLGVLMRVAMRPKPQINIGAVDMSCAFVVCDVTQHDCPIVYCSEVFERLTGYTKHEILGRNCRFLQAPDGKVQSGIKRKYVDDRSVLYLKNMINAQQEAQISVINYRKGGQPFMNLLTIIPVTYDSDSIKYFVGFQVDLVEQPTSITNKNPDGSYAINYQRGLLPRYVFNTPENNNSIQRESDMDRTIGRDDVSAVLTTMGSGDSELSKRLWDKVLLENTDDVVHVLSLKGLFLYLSPSSRKILEYEPHELAGTALSSVCHPSDIVPVTRELKDTSSGAAVSVVFRIRRKHSGYTWFESHGSLHTEQGKGKKCIILVGRQRPVYALARSDIQLAGGIGEGELWTKMSTSGMFLYVSSNSRILLDRPADDLIGTSAQLLMRPDLRLEFGRMLEKARSGIRATFKHEVLHKRGHTLHAQTIVYPGDACEGQKPTFLVAQTRLLKLSRREPPGLLKHNSGSFSNRTGSDSPALNPPRRNQTSPPPTSRTNSGTTPAANIPVDCIVTQAGGSGFMIGTQADAIASEDNVFDELKTTRSTSWQFELRQMEKQNRLLAEELQSLLSNKKKRKRRKGAGQLQKDCANCHTRSTPEWRRGPSGNRDLCNSCGLRWAKQNGRISSRTSSQQSDKRSASPTHSSPRIPFTQTTPFPSSTVTASAPASGAKKSPTFSQPASGTHVPTFVTSNKQPSASTNRPMDRSPIGPSPANGTTSTLSNLLKHDPGDLYSGEGNSGSPNQLKRSSLGGFAGGSGIPAKIEEGVEY